MRILISYTALGLALCAGSTAADAQVITRDQPVETVITQQPAQTVQTVETTRTVRPAHNARTTTRQVVTTRRTIVTQSVAPVPTVAAAYPQPLYDLARPPLYDTVVAPPPPPVFGTMPVAETVVPPAYGAPAGAPVSTYRYIYQSDRILVIDPTTNIAIEAIPR
jgi:hypothetical protein